jgi:hypothetical protein
VLALLLILGIALSIFVYNMIDPAQASARRQARTEATLREVREALIGWSVQRTSTVTLPDARPGELPCPDINPLDGFEDGSCAAGAIGRVPWRTLGVPEPKDETGETLWYSIAGPFRIWNTNANPINSDTRGNLTVYQDSVATTLTTEAIAVIFAPGAPIGAQDRDASTTTLCPTTGTPIPRNACAANYLETTATVNNANLGGPFIRAQGSNSFNDKLLVVTTADLITVVEQRVARELITLLKAYGAATSGKYTGANQSYTNEEDNDKFWGWLPLCQAEPQDWEDLGIVIPTWLTNNEWWRVIYYAVAPDKTVHCPGSPAGCGMLTVDSANNVEVVLITPGPAPAGVTRASLSQVAPFKRIPDPSPACTVGPALSQSEAQTYWQQYLSPNDPDNYNTPFDNTYKTPSSTAYVRNRLYTIP